MLQRKFVDAYPTQQNALDIFEDRWACTVPDGFGGSLKSGSATLFMADARPGAAAQAFGDGFGRFDGQTILELGPLEAAHTYQLELLGANVVAIEGNAEAYLKCLIVKEILGLRAKMYLGNFISFLKQPKRRYDMIFASGVLYHMSNPLQLLGLMANSTDRIFVWTHYYDAAIVANRKEEALAFGGHNCVGYRLDYGDSMASGQFWGGMEDHSVWLPKEELFRACRSYGLDQITIHEDTPGHQNGPCITFCASRSVPR